MVFSASAELNPLLSLVFQVPHNLSDLCFQLDLQQLPTETLSPSPQRSSSFFPFFCVMSTLSKLYSLTNNYCRPTMYQEAMYPFPSESSFWNPHYKSFPLLNSKKRCCVPHIFGIYRHNVQKMHLFFSPSSYPSSTFTISLMAVNRFNTFAVVCCVSLGLLKNRGQDRVSCAGELLGQEG